MTEAEFIQTKRRSLPRETWVKMMQTRKAMQDEGKKTEEIIKALEADARFK